jgi:diguanylate cyclase (GGDEF)-like protein
VTTPATLRVLYAEDSGVDADLTKTHFELTAPEIELEVVDSGQQCFVRLKERTYDVLLLDNHLRDMEGIEILKEIGLKQIPVPVVMVTGVGDEALVVQVLRLGAADYVVKRGNYLNALAAVLKRAATEYRRAQDDAKVAGPRPRRILYVERHPADIDLTQKHFTEFAAHLELQVVHTANDALTVLQKDDMDLVLSDLRLADMSALDLLRETKQRGLHTPFIVITGKGDEEAAIAALKLGASDYIVKRENYLTQLPYAIENAISRAQLVHVNQRLQTELRERERAEARVRQLNTALEERFVQRTRELEAAHQELEETTILELIAQNAPLTEICGRLATLLAVRTNAFVSIITFSPADRYRTAPRSGPIASEPDGVEESHRQTAFAIAKPPDGTMAAAPSVHLAGTLLLDMLTAAEQQPSHHEFPIRSTVGQGDLGTVTLYEDADRPIDAARRRILERCTKLGAIAIHRAHSEERVRRQALEDPLTGLPNRVLWRDRLDQALAAAGRHGWLVAVLLYDLDRFKDVNDTLGHDVGDRVLRHVAAQLEHSMRPEDTVGRIGGDEFALVLPTLPSADEAYRIAQRGLTAIEQPLQLENVVLKLKASVGLALHPTHGNDPTHLLRRADVAMYRVKRLGGGIAVYDANRDQEQLESLSFVAELQRAIEANQLLLCYQPMINLATGALVGVECLVRWDHPTRGMLRPAQIVPVAESTGLIKPLSLWVIQHALHDCQSWYESDLAIPVSVNLAAPLLYDPELTNVIRRELEASHIRRGHLQVEITESTLMLEPEHAMKTVSRLRDSGIAFALDDFGTGYSSLAYLKNLQVESIKIDQSFVRDMVTDPRDESIVKAAIELGHSFGLDVVAEGVESVAARDLLKRLGCDHGQGFLFAKPMPASEFVMWYAERQQRRF